MEITLRKF
jgi:hypothetical protein